CWSSPSSSAEAPRSGSPGSCPARRLRWQQARRGEPQNPDPSRALPPPESRCPTSISPRTRPNPESDRRPYLRKRWSAQAAARVKNSHGQSSNPVRECRQPSSQPPPDQTVDQHRQDQQGDPDIETILCPQKGVDREDDTGDRSRDQQQQAHLNQA